MTKTLLAAVIICVSAGTAGAGGQADSIGIGAEFQLSGLGGLSGSYDAGKFHFGGFLGLSDPAGANNTTFDIGGRFFYHVHSTAMSDFSVGGGLGIRSRHNPTGSPGTDVDLFLEPGFQIRAFLASNVAVSFTGGLSIGTIDASGVALSGEVFGAAGIHYYF